LIRPSERDRSFSVMNKWFFASIAVLPVLACGQTVSLDDRPCPCASGWTCCPSQNVCIAEGGECPGGSGNGSSGSSGTPPPVAPSTDPVVLSHAQSARCITASRERVYWQNADGLVVSVASSGGDQWTGALQTPTANNPRCGIVVRDDEIWTTSYNLGKIIIEHTPGSPQDGVVAFVGKLEAPSSIAVDGDVAYVTEFTAGRVTKVARDGTTTTIASGLARPDRIAIDANNIYWLELGSSESATDTAVKAIPKSGGSQYTLAAVLDRPGDLALAGNRLYYTTRDHVYGMDITSLDATPSFTFSGGISLQGPIATDGHDVFWSDLDGIHRQAVTAGGGEILDPKSVVLALAVDDLRAYWTDGESVTAIAKFK
jgi:hypothetical protein